MKIIMVCYPSPGGSGVVATELGSELSQRGHEVHVVSYHLPFRLHNGSSNVYYHKVELNEYPLFPYPLLTMEVSAKLVETIEKVSPDLIHVHYALPHTASALLARRAVGSDVKIVTTLHGTDVTVWGKNPSMAPLLRSNLEECDALTAVSQSLKEEAIEVLGLTKPVQVIYNFIDTGYYKKEDGGEMRQKLAPGGEKIILHVSNFRAVKRVPDLLRAFAFFQRRFSNAVLVLAGSGAAGEEILNLAEKLGIREQLRMLDASTDLVPLYSAADLFLLPSEKESFGLVALEAMGCGVPIVATDTGGLPELVDHGKNGYLVPVGDVAALAACMERLLTDENLYGSFSKEARRKADFFAVSRVVPLYERLYEGLMAR